VIKLTIYLEFTIYNRVSFQFDNRFHVILMSLQGIKVAN